MQLSVADLRACAATSGRGCDGVKGLGIVIDPKDWGGDGRLLLPNNTVGQVSTGTYMTSWCLAMILAMLLICSSSRDA